MSLTVEWYAGKNQLTVSVPVMCMSCCISMCKFAAGVRHSIYKEKVGIISHEQFIHYVHVYMCVEKNFKQHMTR